MLKELYEAVRRDARPEAVLINGHQYTTEDVRPVLEKEPRCLDVTTLTALVDYLTANMDKHDVAALPRRSPGLRSYPLQALRKRLQPAQGIRVRQTRTTATAVEHVPAGEEFNFLLQSCFVEPDAPVKATDRGRVLKYASNVTTTVEANTEDDGVTQAVTVRKGIAGKGVDVLPNPVTLRPYRTFTEVEQPASRFVFRCKDNNGVTFALVEADGGAWRGEAIRNIKAFMESRVPGLTVIA